MKTLIQEIKKRKEVLLYLFFGGCTTLVNIISYFVLRQTGIAGITISTIVSWILSVLFAYITNKIFVFESKTTTLKELANEFIAFVSGRLFTGFLDLVIMLVFVDVLNFNEAMMKIFSNVIVVVLNYIFSKLWIFKNNKEK